METKKQHKIPSFGYSVLVLAALAGSTFVGMKILGAKLSTIMFINWLLMSLLAIPLGYSYDELEKKVKENVSGILTTLFILFAIGAMVGTWMASGTVPAIIYYGMNIISARFFLITALLLCSVVSLATGTSWGTLGTMGVALLGIGAGLGVPVGMTAGAVICGAWFGDKVSPLSDTTNFTAAIVGTPLMTHVKNMMYTTGPAYIATAAIFTILGFKVSGESVIDYTLISEIQSGIAGSFKLGFGVAIPVVVVMVMLMMRKNPTLAILVGAVVGAVVAIAYQGLPSSVAFSSFYGGFGGEFESAFLSKLLNRGGIMSMIDTSITIIFCVGVGGMMKTMGVIDVMVQLLSKGIRSIGSLILVSEVIAYVSQMLSGSHYFADVVLQSTMLDLYKEKRLKPENLSRVMEDCNTIGGTLIPWSSTAIFIIGTLGITFGEYVPYVFLCYLTPLMGLVCGFTGWGLPKYTEEEYKALKAAETVVS